MVAKPTEPRVLVSRSAPVELSVAEFDLDSGAEPFLTCTWGDWPPIDRGDGDPFMQVPGGQVGATTTHPLGQRVGCWLTQEAMRDAERDEVDEALKALRARGANATAGDLDALLRAEAELQPTGPSPVRAHDEVFRQRVRGYDVVGQQGCGDLTMNEWNVAFLNDALAESGPVLICVPDELAAARTAARTYSCLVKWKPSAAGPARLSIEPARFQFFTKDDNDRVHVRFGSRWLPRGARIDFAVSSQQVLRDGAVVPAAEIAGQFSDRRHLLSMPNLNRMGRLYPSERPGGRPRLYSNRRTFDDVWLGEQAFKDDDSGNLFRAALRGPVFLDFPDGADEDAIRGAFTLAGYAEQPGALAPLAPGEWRFVTRRLRQPEMEVHFRRNTYGWTMIGLTDDARKVLCLACKGQPGRSGYRLEQAAEILREVGARDALLIDEGADAFQFVDQGTGLKETVTRSRNRMRATFVFARPRRGVPTDGAAGDEAPAPELRFT